MGKPYEAELAMLDRTWKEACQSDISQLATAVTDALTTPLIAIGSGGSLAAAEVAAHLHMRYSSQHAAAVTPYELIGRYRSLRDSTAMLFSAGGNNADSLAAFRHLVHAEPRSIVVVCGAPDSRLGRLARKADFTVLHEFTLSSGRDGFLATNSLIAMTCLSCRAYLSTTDRSDAIERRSLWSPLGIRGPVEKARARLLRETAHLWDKDHLVILHSPGLKPAAVDLESRFSEAALGTVQLADFRNFGHGRHHWFAKRGATSAVLALTDVADVDLCSRTLAPLPSSIPQFTLTVADEPAYRLVAALAFTMVIAGAAGLARGIDPGKPGVPAFGRQIYHLRARSSPKTQSRWRVAVERKRRCPIEVVELRGDVERWRTAYHNFVRRLTTSRYGALILDYDGTLCNRTQRYSPLDSDVAQALIRLLAKGLLLGIATGRGDSVRDSLKASLPKHLWNRVIIGHYNGGCVTSLAATFPARRQPDGDLAKLLRVLGEDVWLSRKVDCRANNYQVTCIPRAFTDTVAIRARVQTLLSQHGFYDLQARSSSHSVDILAPGVTKLKVAAVLKRDGIPSSDILCIGDRGCWPGNDCDLLSGQFGLSVDECSPSPESCWNIAPAGVRGPRATLYYLRQLQIRRGLAAFTCNTLMVDEQ